MTFPRLLGGAPVLDFVDTVDPRVGPEVHDYVTTPEALAGWATYAGLVRRPRVRGTDELRRALDVRETLHRVFLAVAHGTSPRRADLEAIRDAYAAVLRRARLERDGDAYRWRVPASAGVDAILLPVLESGLELLSSPALARVKECPAENCGWLFLDTSRNASRRWCSMEGCGSRAKMRRYRARVRS